MRASLPTKPAYTNIAHMTSHPLLLLPQGHIKRETNGATIIPTSKAELKEKGAAADDEVAFGVDALADVEPAGVADVADVVVPDAVVEDTELAVPLADEVAEPEDVEVDVVELEEPFPFA